MIPLYGFLEGDTVGLVIFIAPEDTLAKLAARLQQAARLRVAPKRRPRVVFQGRVRDSQLTVAAAGLTALDRFDVVEEETP
jgi:hypothetical protein